MTANFLTDNPELYERHFPDPDHIAARFIHDILARFAGPGPRTLLDVGCGTGRDAGRLAELGHTVTGLDRSTRMIAYARSGHPSVEFVVGDMRSFALPGRFEAISCMDSAMLYCHTNADLTAFLARCRAHLLPGGLLIGEMRNGAFLLTDHELLSDTTTGTVSWRGVRYTSHTRLWIDHAAQLLRRERIWEWPGCGEPLRQYSAWRLLFPQEFRYFLEQAGFEVLAMFDQPGPRADAAWQADAALSTTMSGYRLHVVARRAASPGF